MSNRWQVLALLFGVRMTMAFQFQAVAALSPFIMSEYGFDIADIGLMIGLYFAPGVVIAYPGGELGKRFGEKRVVLWGLLMMMAGGLMMVASASWEMQFAGRLLAGVGGVLLNVLMTKMLTDWFAGREIATAMGIFVNSWPFGIALALLLLPALAEAASLTIALLGVVCLVAAGFAALAFAYQPAAQAGTGQAASQAIRLGGTPLAGIVCAGLIWGLYNAALGMIFGFAPAMLAEKGWTATAASSVTSIVLWLVAVSVPLGGIIADRVGRNDAVLATGLLLFGMMLFVAARTDMVFLSFVLLGAVAGISAGPIMSLPSRVLAPANRATGMGVFYSVYYLIVVLGPLVAGRAAETTGNIAITFDLGTTMLGASAALLLAFRYLGRIQVSA
ncbi:MAG: MFS transporter [Anderseniella sp.]|jgi:MFS family permease|nr:MFS transporter [Anderseniella sp.]